MTMLSGQIQFTLACSHKGTHTFPHAPIHIRPHTFTFLKFLVRITYIGPEQQNQTYLENRILITFPCIILTVAVFP